MNFSYRFSKAFAAFLLSSLCAPFPLLASDHGGGASGPETLVFTVNLGSSKYLQLGLVLETGSPEAAHEVSAFKPKVQHEIILMLSGRDEEKLRTLPGKKELADDIIDAVNHVIHMNQKTGVNEALFTNFIIQ